MWGGFSKKYKKSMYGELCEEGDDEELNPMLSKNSSSSDSFFSNYETPSEVPQTAQTGMAQTKMAQTQVAPIPQIRQENKIAQGLDINLDSIDEFTKITDDVYVCSCGDISADFLQSVGFNSIINISSQNNVLPNTNSVNSHVKYMNITLNNIQKSTTYEMMKNFITDGKKKPNVILNFMNDNVMVIMMLYYITVNKLSGSDFTHKYNFKALPNEYLHVLYSLIPELDKFKTDENFLVLTSMFPDMPRNQLEKLYNDSNGNLEYAVSMIFS